MTWRLAWSIVAERDLRELPWRTALASTPP
jgi:hypothetical protein